MINAMLVFNNSGQPRLTKFYTQLVSTLKEVAQDIVLTIGAGHKRSATTDIRNIHTGRQQTELRM